MLRWLNTKWSKSPQNCVKSDLSSIRSKRAFDPEVYQRNQKIWAGTDKIQKEVYRQWLYSYVSLYFSPYREFFVA